MRTRRSRRWTARLAQNPTPRARSRQRKRRPGALAISRTRVTCDADQVVGTGITRAAREGGRRLKIGVVGERPSRPRLPPRPDPSPAPAPRLAGRRRSSRAPPRAMSSPPRAPRRRRLEHDLDLRAVGEEARVAADVTCGWRRVASSRTDDLALPGPVAPPPGADRPAAETPGDRLEHRLHLARQAREHVDVLQRRSRARRRAGSRAARPPRAGTPSAPRSRRARVLRTALVASPQGRGSPRTARRTLPRLLPE